MNTRITFNSDLDGATIFVSKIYHNDVSEIWESFSNPENLNKWWAPFPWKCETYEFDFEPGGNLYYAMIGPENEKTFGLTNFEEINFHRSISWTDSFSDENKNINPDFPQANWLIGFTGVEEGTKLTINLHLKNREELRKFLDMGFEEGFKTGLNQLEELLR